MNANAQSKDYEYEPYSTYASIEKYNGTDANVVISSTFVNKIVSVSKTYKVNAIAENAFANCKTMKTLTLPTSVKTISRNAFTGCTSLTDVYYTGSKSDWNKININSVGNSSLTSARIHYNASYSNHPYTSKVTRASTCTRKGEMTWTCPCGYSYTEAIPELDHEFGNLVRAKEASCTEAGTLAYYQCNVCGGYFDTDKVTKLSSIVVPAKGHTPGAWVTTLEPTCTVAGSKEQHCSVCDAVMGTAAVPAKGHTPGAWVTTLEPTCTVAGSKEQHCSVCNAVIGTDEIPAKGHEFGALVEAKDASCTEAGNVAYYQCDVCKKYFDTDKATELSSIVIPAKGHTPGEWKITLEPTCTVAGSKEQYCSVCDAVIDTDEIPAKGHTLGEWVTVDATCTEDGLSTQSCLVCNEVVNSRVIPTKGHVGRSTTTKATLTSDGSIVTVCTVCGDTISTVVIPKVKYIGLSKTRYTYDGKAHTPIATVIDNAGNTLKYGTDYSISYVDNIEAGVAKAIVTMSGNYSGSKELIFRIYPETVGGVTASNITSNNFTLSWDEVSGATGYEVYAYNKLTNSYVKVYAGNKTSVVISSLSASTDYSYVVKARIGDMVSEASDMITIKTKTAASKTIGKVSNTKGKVIFIEE